MADLEIHIPKGCSCPPEAVTGNYLNQVELPTPAHMLAIGQLGCLSFRPTTCIDRCIADAVQALWAVGVVTTGCCCGHNQLDGYIGIWQPDTAEHGVIRLSPAELQSGLDRVRWAENLIRQLPEDHDGRNSWLLNYGRSEAMA